MEYIIFAVFALLIVIAFFVKGYFDYKKQEKKFIKSLYSNYGEFVEREYKPERFINIPSYYEKHKDGFFIDDITWNDLNMDEVFMQMNTSMSAAGEEYLYYMLRTPSFDKEVLEKREELILAFCEKEEERVKCQFLFHKLGFTGKYSLYDYLDYLDKLGIRSNTKHYLALIFVLIGIVLLFVEIPLGIAMLFIVFILNILSYFKTKSEIDPYITSFSYIFRLLDTVDKLCKIKMPELQTRQDILKKASADMVKFKRGSFWLMSPGRMSASGNPLEMILDYFRMALHLDLMQFNKMLSQVRGHIAEIDSMITIIGEIDALIAIGAYRAYYEEVCVPVFVKEKKVKAEALYHPLIKEPVKNDIETTGSILITGSNASGKSTFLKTVALNVILAQTVHTCMAVYFETSMFRVCSSMALRDDIEGGDSYYIVEIKALKRIMDMVKTEGAPVLCFVDEVLRGTNTVERIAASVQILKSLNTKDCLCFAATHDIELTHLLEEEYHNYHFEEEVADNDIFFSYKILDGRARTRNAIKLLEIMGYDKAIIETAEKMAADFVNSGNWTKG